MPHALAPLLTAYLSEIRNQRPVAGTTEELSYRDYLGRMLRETAQAAGKPCDFTGEAKTAAWGRPDYRVTNGAREIGYVEAEKLGITFAKIAGSAKEQNERFRNNLHNFLFTDHLQFIVFVDGKPVAECQLPNPPALGKVTVSDAVCASFADLLERFLSESSPSAVSAEMIARQLAKRARFLENAAGELLLLPDGTVNAESPLAPFYNAYRTTLFDEITGAEFADVYAQTFTYGLFLAWYSRTAATAFVRENALRELPRTVPAIRVLLASEAGTDPPEAFLWILDGICADLNAADRAGVLKPYADGRDPIFHFYETFLAAYDPKLREKRGVYYTPDAVVKFIVRAVNDLLRDTFARDEGIADATVTLLDPATGTGTFLAEAYRTAHATLAERGDGGYFPSRAKDHLTRNLYGIELLPSAYTIAHIKLRAVLDQLGANLPKDARLPVYLASSLDDSIVSQQDLPVVKPLIAERNEAARIVGSANLLVVMGNPPYSGHSANPSKKKDGTLTSIGELLRDYYFVNGVPLGERNSKWLQDDYVKFLRFAENIVRKNGEGMVAFITNNGYLDNPTFRGMRRHLMQTFDRIYLLDLHGNSKKRETAPGGGADENVFDIQQGVGIGIFVKSPALAAKPSIKKASQRKASDGSAEIFHADLYGTRASKYETLATSDLGDIGWQTLAPTAPFYLFAPQDTDLREEYDPFWSVQDIFPVNVLGFQTHRDNFAIDFDKEMLRQRIATLRTADKIVSDADISERYGIKDGKTWLISEVRNKLRANLDWERALIQCAYRPFDNRPCYFSGVVMDRPRSELLRHVFQRDNPCLLVPRQQATVGFHHVFVAKIPANDCVMSTTSREANQVFPLWLYPTEKEAAMGIKREANLKPAFVEAIAERIGDPPTPEAAFHYIYAVLHAPTYRARYAPFLKIDFPRIPLPPNRDTFDELAVLGETLVALHLLESPQLKNTGIGFPVAGSNLVEKRTPEKRFAGGTLYLNQTQTFDNVSEAVWNFRVGGYLPAQKWLADRAGRTLTEEEITHYRRVLAALRETVALLPDVDAAFAEVIGE